jgi:hypothetical protein
LPVRDCDLHSTRQTFKQRASHDKRYTSFFYNILRIHVAGAGPTLSLHNTPLCATWSRMMHDHGGYQHPPARGMRQAGAAQCRAARSGGNMQPRLCVTRGSHGPRRWQHCRMQRSQAAAATDSTAGHTV